MRQFSKITIFIGAIIIISASFARQLSDSIKSLIGETGFIILMGLIFVSTGLAFLNFIIKHKTSFARIVIIILILFIGSIFVWQIRIPVERIHILEYACLGWFAIRDLIYKNKKFRAIVSACMFSIFIGLLDELFQAILPYRHFDLRDISFNSLGSIYGVILYLLSIDYRSIINQEKESLFTN